MKKEKIKFVHTNLIAKDWRRLADFYIHVFGCKPVYPERNLFGEWVWRLTKIENVEIKGIHLLLPGDNHKGITLEIFEYNVKPDQAACQKINNYGFGHIAFHVDNITEILNKIIENGGQYYGELIETTIDEVGNLKVVYTKDIEGNIIELQNLTN